MSDHWKALLAEAQRPRLQERFDPHQVQAEYLRLVGFRTKLLRHIRTSRDYSNDAYTDRIMADEWLWMVLQAFYSDLNSLPGSEIIVLRVNKVIENYGLGAPIREEEFDR